MKKSLVSWPGRIKPVAPVGFGCCPMGGHGWGHTEKKQLIEAVSAALDCGISLFDTADIYGLGESESTLGSALGKRREDALIATKFGVRFENGRSFYDTSVSWINQALEGSLRRLKTEWIDLYQMHYWDSVTPIEAIVSELERLVAQGKIRSYGVTNFNPQCHPRKAVSSAFASYSYQYSLVDRNLEPEILAIQEQTSLTFMSWGSLGQGVLSGKYQARTQLDQTDRRQRPVYKNFHGAQFEAIQVLLSEMKTIAAELGDVSLSQLSLRWIVDRIPRAIPLVGIKRPEQIIDAAGILEFQLPPEACSRLEQLTRQYIPTSPSI